jgi:hypothetical protein
MQLMRRLADGMSALPERVLCGGASLAACDMSCLRSGALADCTNLCTGLSGACRCHAHVWLPVCQ